MKEKQTQGGVQGDQKPERKSDLQNESETDIRGENKRLRRLGRRQKEQSVKEDIQVPERACLVSWVEAPAT